MEHDNELSEVNTAQNIIDFLKGELDNVRQELKAAEVEGNEGDKGVIIIGADELREVEQEGLGTDTFLTEEEVEGREELVVATAGGLVLGIEDYSSSGVRVDKFLGIPYAKPPLGKCKDFKLNLFYFTSRCSLVSGLREPYCSLQFFVQACYEVSQGNRLADFFNCIYFENN